MAIRKNIERGFVDAMLEGSTRTAGLLERLDAATPWRERAAPILRLPEYSSAGAGRPTWDPLVMLKAMMLAKWFNLSDPGLEGALKDRISFRRFVGRGFDDRTPDEISCVVLRRRLRESGLHEQMFASVVAHIEAQGLLVKEGTRVDATIIEQSRGRTREDGTSTRDTDASFTSKHGRTHHGYKGHIAVDFSKVVTGYRLTTASEHDSRRIDEYVEDERHAVIADSAYSSHERRASLRERGVIDGIIYKRHRGQDVLHRWQERWNTAVSRLRAKVEHPLGMLKQQLGYRRVRYRGQHGNQYDFALTLAACNRKRSLSLRGRKAQRGARRLQSCWLAAIDGSSGPGSPLQDASELEATPTTAGSRWQRSKIRDSRRRAP